MTDLWRAIIYPSADRAKVIVQPNTYAIVSARARELARELTESVYLERVEEIQ